MVSLDTVPLAVEVGVRLLGPGIASGFAACGAAAGGLAATEVGGGGAIPSVASKSSKAAAGAGAGAAVACACGAALIWRSGGAPPSSSSRSIVGVVLRCLVERWSR